MLTNLPRILAIVYALFLAVLALDIFNIPFLSGEERLVAFLMHLIPSFLTIGDLIISWKMPNVGGVLFLILAVGFTLWFQTYGRLDVFLTVSAPLIVIGGLFLWDGARRGK